MDNTSKGSFVASSLAAAGFTGPLSGAYSHASTSTASAQAALRQLIFAPTPNRVPVGSSELTTFTLIVSDGATSRTNSATTVTSVSVNDAPIASDDGGAGFTTTEIAAFTTASVLTNDFDADPGDVLSVVTVLPINTIGTVTNLGNGTFRYDPHGRFSALASGQTATDSFAYVVSDSHGATATARVTITITGVNQPPVAANVALSIKENSGAQVITPQLLTAAFDPDGGDQAGLTISAVNTVGTHGAVQLLAGDVLTYNPNSAFANLAPGATASDSFGFTVTDGHGGFSSARANITIVGVNDVPVAGSPGFSVLEHDTGTNLTTGILAGATDGDPGEAATLQITAIDPSTTIGFVTFTNGNIFYSPNRQFESLAEGETNTDTFNFTVQDIHGASTIGTATITIVGQNDPPLPTPAFITVNDGGSAMDLTASLLVPVTDPDNGETATLTVSGLVETNLSSGAVEFSNGVVTYHPPTLFLPAGTFVTNAFSYAVRDVHGAISNGIAVIYIVGVNSAPLIDCGLPLVFECGSTSASPHVVSVNVSDPDGNALDLVWTLNGMPVQTNSFPAGTAPNSNTVVLATSLPLGTNLVVVSVSDGIAPPVFCTSTATVLDTTTPVITMFGANPYTNECHAVFTDPGATALDACAGSVAVTTNGVVNPNSPGSYTLTYIAADGNGNSTTNSRTVIVRDSTPPALTCPSSLLVDATNMAGNVVFYSTPVASDLCSGTNVLVISQPASGSLFPIGTNYVTCAASDPAQNTNTCVFTVTVLGIRSMLLDVLAQTLTLRNGSVNATDITYYNQLIAALTGATDISLWVDEIDLQRKTGLGEFTALLSGMDALCSLVSRATPATQPALRSILTRIESAERLLASIAIQNALLGGAAVKRIDQANQQLAQGDNDAANGRCSSCIAHYKNGWDMSEKAMLSNSLHVGSHVQLEIWGDANKSYTIEASTNLINWSTLVKVKADTNGIIDYDAGPSSTYRVRYFRTLSQ
ncbi:MAG TPA: Ig-like domain-containing protein [Candidatus Dormibacteraeota bacterium]|nr:Ig-like domain-containing protein [Candidatus Dormibacteraeota bacterium]